MVFLRDISYKLPNKELLFGGISLTVNNHDKVSLIGNNGAGKSTLLKIIANELQPSDGEIIVSAKPYFVPQLFGQYNHLSVAAALGVDGKIAGLKAILNGSANDRDFEMLNDDWTIEERCNEALNSWQLNGLELTQKMETLSGGQKTKVFLAGISIHQAQLILLDEPSNHLDLAGRQLLYDFIQSTKSTVIAVSHDRKLLHHLDTVFELSEHGLKMYGGNYDFYAEQKQAENNALNQDIQSKETALRKAREKERETIERKQKLDSRGKGKQEKAGVAKIMMNTLRNKAQTSTSKIKSVHAEKIGGIRQELQDLRSSLPGIDKMKLGIAQPGLHKGKVLFSGINVNFTYDRRNLWSSALTFEITSGERIALKGQNGSGKTTLIKLITGSLEPQAGTVYRAGGKSIYIDQDYSLPDDKLSVYEQTQRFNSSALQEHEIKTRLNRFLFGKDDWDKQCKVLSGGERMRLLLCCLTIDSQAPDIIFLDEPTNNLDIQNIEILTAAINEYQGTLIAVSHDEIFLDQISIERTIML